MQIESGIERKLVNDAQPKPAQVVSGDQGTIALSDSDDGVMTSDRGAGAVHATAPPGVRDATAPPGAREAENVDAGPAASKRVPSSLEEQKRLARERGRLKAMQRGAAASSDKAISASSGYCQQPPHFSIHSQAYVSASAPPKRRRHMSRLHASSARREGNASLVLRPRPRVE